MEMVLGTEFRVGDLSDRELWCKVLKHEALRFVSGRVMPDRISKKKACLLRAQPVITRIDSFKSTAMCLVWALRHHTGAQYCRPFDFALSDSAG